MNQAWETQEVSYQNSRIFKNLCLSDISLVSGDLNNNASSENVETFRDFESPVAKPKKEKKETVPSRLTPSKCSESSVAAHSSI